MSNGNELAVRSEQAPVVALNREQMDILKATICKDASDQEMMFFGQVCRAKQMDPFSGEIFLVKRDGKPVIQTGIDGFRAQAERSGAYAGNDDPVFDVPEGRDKPVAARVTVYKMVLGVRVPFTATVRWDEFYPGDKLGFMWRSKPFHMLGKCAEAQALRKAFPKQLSGMHIPEEMDKVESAAIDEPAAKTTTKLKAAIIAAPAENPLDVRRQRALKAFEKFNKTAADVCKMVGVAKSDEITAEHLDGILTSWIDELRGAQDGNG